MHSRFDSERPAACRRHYRGWSDIAARGWNLLKGDLPLPAAVIERDALHHNSRWMRGFLDLTRVGFSPHGKTTMAPQLFDLQLRDGAWAITVATMHQLKVCRAFGIDRVLMANQLTGRLEIDDRRSTSSQPIRPSTSTA